MKTAAPGRVPWACRESPSSPLRRPHQPQLPSLPRPAHPAPELVTTGDQPVFQTTQGLNTGSSILGRGSDGETGVGHRVNTCLRREEERGPSLPAEDSSLSQPSSPDARATCSVHAPGAHGDGGAAAEGSVARVTLGSQKGGPRSRGPGRGGGGGGTVWSGQKRHPGNGTGACGHHGSESFLFNPLPPPASPARAGRRTRVRRRRDRQTRGRWLLESAMTGADILQASSPHQEQAGGTARHLREAASARTSPSAAEEIGPRTR